MYICIEWYIVARIEPTHKQVRQAKQSKAKQTFYSISLFNSTGENNFFFGAILFYWFSCRNLRIMDFALMSMRVRALVKKLMFEYSIHFYRMKLLSTTEKLQGRFISLHTYIVFVIPICLCLFIYLFFLCYCWYWCWWCSWWLCCYLLLFGLKRMWQLKVSALSITRHIQNKARSDKS